MSMSRHHGTSRSRVSIYHMDRNGVEQAVLIQESAQTDDSYLFECAPAVSRRFSVVVNVDSTRPNVIETIEYLRDQGAAGLRLKAGLRSASDDRFAIWRTAAELGLAISCSGLTVDYLDDELTLCAQAAHSVALLLSISAPHQRSSRKPPLRSPDRPCCGDWRCCPTCTSSSTGSVSSARGSGPAVEPFPFIVPICRCSRSPTSRLGANRLMWGSDFPPVSHREAIGTPSSGR